MLKGNEIIGQPILANDTGIKLDNKIKDLLIDYHSEQLVGFLVDGASGLSDAHVLPFNQIKTFNTDAVKISSQEAIAPVKQEKRLQQILEQKIVLRGKTIMTTEGQALGTIVDIYFDERTGAITGYEVSVRRLIEDRPKSSFMPIAQVFKIGKEPTLVWLNATEQTVTAIDICLQTLAQKAKEQPQEDKQFDEKERNLWEQIKAQASKIYENGVQTWKEAPQIKSVLGHPVTRVILDEQSQVILNVGDLITHQAVERARQADVLDLLISAVYRKKSKESKLSIPELYQT